MSDLIASLPDIVDYISQALPKLLEGIRSCVKTAFGVKRDVVASILDDRLRHLLLPMSETNDAKMTALRALRGYAIEQPPTATWESVRIASRSAGQAVSELAGGLRGDERSAFVLRYSLVLHTELLALLDKQRELYASLAAADEPSDAAELTMIRHSAEVMERLYKEVTDMEKDLDAFTKKHD